MFTTFHGTSLHAARHKDAAAAAAAAANRPKRNQVRRACDWCKLMRIKCDNHRPCSNCQQAGHECATNGPNQFRSIAAAAKEVERLRAQVREFERGRKYENDRPSQSPSPANANANANAPGSASASASVSANADPDTDAADTARRASLSGSYSGRPSASRNGVRVNELLYGVTSLPFFLTRLSAFLGTARHRPPLDIAAYSTPCLAHPHPHCLGTDYLPRVQEEHFLQLFWQTHYFSYPIIDEADFRREYQAQWAGRAPDAPRPASPLVDIVLALCLQLGAFGIHQATDAGDAGDAAGRRPPASCCATLAGYQYYRRCQKAIDESLETPSITTVLCCVFSVVYLYEAGLLSRAQVMTGKAIMMAMILGLPSEPSSSEPDAQKELRRRTWWSLYSLDALLCIEVGRSPVISPSHSTCRLPSDALELARSLGPHYVFDENCSAWLGFQTQTLRLVDTVRTIMCAFYAKYDAVVADAGRGDLDGNGAAREECARFLTKQLKDLNAWVSQVPDDYRAPRRGGQAFSTDRSPLDLSTDVPIHCLRQRLLLELQYHQYCMSLYQPFICFTPASDVSTPLSDSRATAALNHSITLTNMIHQTLTGSEALNGLYHVFRWQKNALFTMLGFAYAFPASHSTAAARKAIETAIAVTDMYRDILPEAGPVAAIARSLADDVSAIISGFRSGGRPATATATAAAAAAAAPAQPERAVAKWRPQAAGGGDAAGPLSDAWTRQDWTNLTSVADELLNLDFLQERGGEANWEAMDALWTSMEPGEGSADSWTSVGDAAGLGESEADSS